MEKTIEQLEKELEDLKASHRSQWDTYGSELCAGDMIRQEEELEKKILRLKTIKRWKESGLLDKYNNPIPSQSKPSDPPVVQTKTIEPIK